MIVTYPLKACAASSNGLECNMDATLAATLREHSELLVALSTSHLTALTQRKLRMDELSVNAYPTQFGGLVFVGKPPHRVPAESDLALIFDTAAHAGVTWLKFDAEAPIIQGLLTFERADPLT